MAMIENAPITPLERILDYWLGHIEQTVLPSSHRQHVWFAGTPDVDQEIREKFSEDLAKAKSGIYQSWEESPRGSLALVILFDQFSRNIYRNTAEAFATDSRALNLVLRGIEKEYDHSLSLIERAFYYMPFMHSENLDMQSTSVRAFKILIDLSFPEARALFERFLDAAIHHYEVIRNFGRFPTRNKLLDRTSTPEEEVYLKKLAETPPEK